MSWRQHNFVFRRVICFGVVSSCVTYSRKYHKGTLRIGYTVQAISFPPSWHFINSPATCWPHSRDNTQQVVCNCTASREQAGSRRLAEAIEQGGFFLLSLAFLFPFRGGIHMFSDDINWMNWTLRLHGVLALLKEKYISCIITYFASLCPYFPVTLLLCQSVTVCIFDGDWERRWKDSLSN